MASTGLFTSLKVLVNQTFQTYPQFMNGFTGFAVFSAGDVLSQSLESVQSGHVIDYGRSLQTGTLGIVMNGVVLHNWYRSLDYAFGSGMKKNPRGILFKTVADQMIYAPFSIVMFFGYSSSMKALTSSNSNSSSNRNNSNSSSSTTDSSSQPTVPLSFTSTISTAVSEFRQKMENSFVSTFAADMCIWPLANVINFRYIPIHYRPTFVGVVQIGWQAYLSGVAHAGFTKPVGQHP